jgi:7-keto-8-aminopelargonate synthetase-like enzyme
MMRMVFGIMGPNRWLELVKQQGCQDGIDVYFGTFAKSFALIGAFISSQPKTLLNFYVIICALKYFAKALPMPLVVGALKRLELLRMRILSFVRSAVEDHPCTYKVV